MTSGSAAALAASRQTLAILVYMFGGWLSSSFVNLFVLCTLLLAADFWTVKNVTGRLMVGLRWNSIVDASGRTTWKFQAQEVRARVAASERARARDLEGAPALERFFSRAFVRRPAPSPCTLPNYCTPLVLCAHMLSWLLGAPQEGLRSTSLDVAVFWVGLFAPGVVWILFGFGSFFSFKTGLK